MKKLWIGVLAFALVLGSIFFWNANSKDANAAEDVASMLNVKFQIATDDSDVIRFVSSVDSLDYQNVGFEVNYAGLAAPKVYTTSTVYERVASEDAGVEYEFSPKVVDLTSKYFVTAKLRATDGVDYKVKAFVTTKDGVKLYGAERSVSLADGADNTINMVVDFATTAGASYDVYEGDTKVGTASVISDKNVRISLSNKKVDAYPSATKFTFKNGSSEVGTAVYRNYYTTYAKNGADTTWYDVDADATTFVIASSADMWGLAKVVNTNVDLLQGQTVVLIRDVAVTEGKLQVANDGTAFSDYTFTGTTLDWAGIGTNANRFKGTFDGDYNTVSGIYTKTETNEGVGLFARVEDGGIKNLRIANSYISGTYMVGGVAGLFKGNAENLYVEDDVVVKLDTSSGVGGIFGQFDTNTKRTISKCWFDGVVVAKKARAAGIIGRIYSAGNLTIENCLNTGTLISSDTSTTPRVGGILGSVVDNNTVNIAIQNSVSMGAITSAKNVTVGTVVGQLAGSKNKMTLQDVYTIATDKFDTTNGGNGFGSSSLDVATVNGKPVIFDTVASLQGEAGYVNTDLDFENVWVATANGPELKVFSEATAIDVSQVTTVRSNQGWYNNAFSNATKGSLALPAAPVFAIDSESDFYAFAVKAGTDTNYRFKGATVNLMTDIDMNPGWNASTKAAAPVAWPGIGTTAQLYFDGAFNGNGHTIKGIYSNNSSMSAGYEALFGYTGSNSTVEDFRLENTYITSAGGNLGSVVGVAKGSVNDIYVADTVLVEGTSTPIGGMIGIYSGVSSKSTTISNCQFDGTVIGGDTRCGGFIGRFYTGKLTIENCLFTGTARGTATNNPKVGGFVAEVAPDANQSLTIKNCLSNGTVESAGTSNVGAVIGSIASAGVITFKNTYAVDHKVYIGTTANATIAAGKGGIGTVAGSVTGIPAIVKANEITGNNAYIYTALDLKGGVWQVSANKTPELVSYTDATPMTTFTGTKVDTQWYNNNWKNSGSVTFTIDTVSELLGFERVEDTFAENFKGHTVQLGADIKLNGDWVPQIDANGNLTNAPSGAVKMAPIGDVKAFEGTFDGKGHTISGVYMTRTENYASLFARIEVSATLKNLAIKDSYIKQTGNKNWTGSLLGFSYGGAVSNVYSNAIVVSDGVQMGGLIARMEGSVTGCWFDGTMMCTRAEWADEAGVGGVVGTTLKGAKEYPLTISNCLNTGEVIWKVDTTEVLGLGGIFGCTRGATPTITITNCINAGSITATGTNGIGAILGMVNEATTKYTIENCYTTTESGVTELLGKDVASAADSAIVTSHALAEASITGSALYGNEDISLDFAVWTARTNGVPVLNYFVNKVVPEADTVAKPTE